MEGTVNKLSWGGPFPIGLFARNRLLGGDFLDQADELLRIDFDEEWS